MTNSIYKTLKSEDGGAMVWVLVVVMILAMVMSLVLSVASTLAVSETVRESTEYVIASYINRVSLEKFSDMREKGEFDSEAEEEKLREIFFDHMNMYESEGVYTFEADNYMLSIEDLEVNVVAEEKLTIVFTYQLKIPIDFFNTTVTQWDIPMKVETSMAW